MADKNFPGIVYAAKRDGNFIRLRHWNRRLRYQAWLDDSYDEISLCPIRGRKYRRDKDGVLRQHITGVARADSWRPVPTDDDGEWITSIPDSGLVEIRELKGDLYRPQHYLVWHRSESDTFIPGGITVDPDWFIRLRKHSLEHSDDPAYRRLAKRVGKWIRLMENGGAAIFHASDDPREIGIPEIEPIDLGDWKEANFRALLTGPVSNRNSRKTSRAGKPCLS